MPVGDVWKTRVVTYHGSLTAAHLGINVYHWVTIIETGIGATALEIATALDGTWFNQYLAVMAQKAFYRGTGAQRIWPLPGGLEATFAGNTAAGGVASDLLSGQAGLLHKDSVFSGRENRGFTFVPFPGEGDNDADNSPTGGYVTRLSALATQVGIAQTIVGAGGTTNLIAVIYHRKVPGTYTIMSNLSADVEWATQRKRMPRGKLRPVPF